MLPPQVRVELGVMAMKKYSAFHKSSALLEPHHNILDACGGEGVVPLYRDAVDIFYSPSRLGPLTFTVY